MKKLFINTQILDAKACEKFGLSSEILMENAAAAMANFVRAKFKKGTRILGVIGSGNNGADVLAALRMLSLNYDVTALLASQNLKPLCQKQLDVALLAGVRVAKFKADENLEIYLANLGAKCVIDGLFGSGLSRDLSSEYISLISNLNAFKAYKIACDVPSGLDERGNVRGACFKANTTITMGARKLGLYSDHAKDFVGRVRLAKLGVSSRNFYQDEKCDFLLTKRDLNLPFRTTQNTNKGSFGHAFVVAGQMSGAAKMAARAASMVGAGLVSVVCEREILNLDAHIMQVREISDKMNAGALGMGLGEAGAKGLDLEILASRPLVIDADMCYNPRTIELLEKNKDIVLTPHPKEFASLLNLAKFGKFSVEQIQLERFELARKFSQKFSATLVLKGANTIIARSGKIYVMRHGSAKLAKGGSGDVLAGLIAGLLAQGYTPLNAAITGTLAHALAARKFRGANYALTPSDIIKGIRWLRKK